MTHSAKQNRRSILGKAEDVAMTLVLILCFIGLTRAAHCQQTWHILPDPAPKPANFWTVRAVSDPPLRSNKQTLKSPWYIVPNVLSIGASIANVTRSRKAGAAYGDAMAGAIPVAGLSFVLDRYVARFIAVGGPLYVIGLRTYGAKTGTYR